MAGDVGRRGTYDALASADDRGHAHRKHVSHDAGAGNAYTHTSRKRDVEVLSTAETPLLASLTKSTKTLSGGRTQCGGADSIRVDQVISAAPSLERVLHPDSPTTPLWRKFFFQFFDDTLSSPTGIQPSDIWELQPECTSKIVTDKLRALYSRDCAASSTSTRNGWHLAHAIVCMEWRSLVASGLLSIVSVVVHAAKPWTLFSLLNVVMAEHASSLMSVPVYAHLLALYVLHVLAHGFSSLAACQSFRIEMRVVSALRALIFETAIREPAQQRLEDKKRIADITTMYEDDTAVIAATVSHIHSGWTRPVLLALEVYLLVLVFDTKATLILAILSLLLLARLAGQIFVSHVRNTWRDSTATRFNLVHECFKGILMVKLNAWEAKFRAKLAHARLNEDTPRRVFGCAFAVSNALGSNSTQIFSAIFFAAAASDTSSFSPAQVFTSLILVDRIRYRMENFIAFAVRTLRGVAAMHKMDRYLRKPTAATERSHTRRTSRSTASAAITEDHVVVIERACFTEGSGADANMLLANVNVKVRHGQLVLIRGDVGTGKSTLLRAMLLDVQPLYGTVAVDRNSRVAYCAQEPWLQTLSIRDNILFGAPFNDAKYQCVLDACCLLDDLKLLPHGDATRVGPKGVNLSGGQKSRIALARACYADADLYVLDCPLASVDAIVQSDVFRKCIVDLLRFKTVVLVSHNPEVATSEFIDQVVTVSDNTCVDVVDSSASHGSRRVCVFEQGAPWKRTRERSSASSHRSLNLWTCDAKAPVSALERSRALSREKAVRAIERELVTVPKQVLPYVLQREFWGPMLLSILAAVLCGAALVAKDLWLVGWISSSNNDDALSSGTNAAVYSGLVALALVACTVERVLTTLAFSRVANRLLGAMTNALLQAPMAFFYATQVGEILKHFFNDMDDLDSYPAMFTSHSFRFAALLVFQVAIIWYLMGVVGVLVVVVVVVALATMFPVTQLYRAHDPTANSDAKRLNFIAEVMDGAASIRAFGESHVERFRVEHGHDSDATVQRVYFVNCFNWFIIMRFTHVYGALLSVLALRLLKNEFSPMELGLTLHYLLMVDENIIGVATGLVNLVCLLPGAHRVCEYCAIEPESSLQLHQTALQPPRAWPFAGAVAFEHVTFSYSGTPDRDVALRDLTFSVAGGQKIGVARARSQWRSFGSIRSCNGRILVDGIDIARLDLRALRSRLCILPQAPMFYRCTVRHYLDPFDEFHDRDLWHAVHQCGLQASVNRLDAELWDDGENWSLGERQALCFVRALLRPSRILVLDESFSALDQTNETKLLALLHDAFAHSTVFLITHRLDQVLQFDKIVVIESGELREVGSAEELASDPSSAFYEFLETTLLTL